MAWRKHPLPAMYTTRTESGERKSGAGQVGKGLYVVLNKSPPSPSRESWPPRSPPSHDVVRSSAFLCLSHLRAIIDWGITMLTTKLKSIATHVLKRI